MQICLESRLDKSIWGNLFSYRGLQRTSTHNPTHNPKQAPHFLANAASRLEQFAWNQGSTGARLTPEPQDIFHFRLRACRSGVGRASQGTLRLLPESHGQNLVLTVLYVLSSLDRALCRAAVCLEPRLDWCTPYT